MVPTDHIAMRRTVAVWQVASNSWRAVPPRKQYWRS